MLTLFYSPFHGFVHKTLVAAHECGLWDEVARVPTFPFRNLAGDMVRGQYAIDRLNPLDKVPTLADERGQVIHGSQAICEFLDSRSKAARLYPEPGPARWDALTRLSLGDSLFDFSVQMSMEQWRPREDWRIDLFEWLSPKIDRMLAKLDRDAEAGWGGFDIGHVGMLQGLSYFASRANHWDGADVVEGRHPWRERHPALAAWYAQAIERPSVRTHLDRPYEGDLSPERHRAALDRVLALQAEHGTR